MYETYKDRIQFMIVYIREAHPELLPEGNKTGIVGRPKDFEERTILATECVMKCRFTLPMVIDGMDGKVNDDYRAAPVRVTITDKDGKTVYYAGPGPFDYNTRKIERVLRKLYENDGYLPPPPPPAWGGEEEGLRLGLTVDPERIALGEEGTVHLVFENRGTTPLTLLFDPMKALEGLSVEDASGKKIALDPAGMLRWMRRMMGRRGRGRSMGRPREIEPHGRYEAELDVQFAAGKDSAPGTYRVRSAYTVKGGDWARKLRRSGAEPWTGTLASGAFTVRLLPERKLTCADCHGDGDYHHEQRNDCSLCHLGEQDSDDFRVKRAACSRCHPREGVQGRRRILGKDGAFGRASVHRSGKLDSKACLECHDPAHHGEGRVRLVDPRSGGKTPWTGSLRGFCLACHTDPPPEGVCFPKPRGSGFDKKHHPCRAPGADKEDCLRCHRAHGSDRPPLLREDFARRPGGEEKETR